MNILKMKAKVYQYAGIFLARKELNTYIESQDFNDEVRRMSSYDDGGPVFSQDECKQLLIGSWESYYGFHTFVSRLPWPLSRFHIIWKQFQYDFLTRKSNDT